MFFTIAGNRTPDKRLEGAHFTTKLLLLDYIFAVANIH